MDWIFFSQGVDSFTHAFDPKSLSDAFDENCFLNEWMYVFLGPFLAPPPLIQRPKPDCRLARAAGIENMLGLRICWDRVDRFNYIWAALPLWHQKQLFMGNKQMFACSVDDKTSFLVFLRVIRKHAIYFMESKHRHLDLIEWNRRHVYYIEEIVF
jgi:hypothetical protein